MARASFDRLRPVAAAGRVLNQNDLPGTNHSSLPVAGGDPVSNVQIDDVLAAGRVVPVQVVGGWHLAEGDARREDTARDHAANGLLGPVDLDVAKVGLSLLVGVEIVDAHR